MWAARLPAASQAAPGAPQASPPRFSDPPGSDHPVGGVLVWGYRLVVGVAAVLSITAIVLTAMKWSSPRPEPAAAPPRAGAGAAAYTAEQIAAAKKDACDASTTTDTPITQVHNALWATKRDSPEWPVALANYQIVMLVETEYLKSKTRPEAPAAVRAAVANAVNAQLAEAEAVTAGTPVAAKVDAVKAAGARLGQVCK